MRVGTKMTARSKLVHAIGLFYMGDDSGCWYWLFKYESEL